ncbi:hypothetical protein C8R43DRAFT_1244000 [Mycena crocata]|nr:hypothetical protein C8R43DRAFT_1244000 [Mycena crocata]
MDVAIRGELFGQAWLHLLGPGFNGLPVPLNFDLDFQYCPTREEYGKHNFHQGSFGSHAIWDAVFLFKVPDGLAPEYAAPLTCSGATVFEAIESYNICPTERVGVIGIGGLGHLAIQFLAKMGANVVVFSSTDAKREEALRLGATEFYATKGVTKFEMEPLNHLLVATSFLPDWKPFLTPPISSSHYLSLDVQGSAVAALCATEDARFRRTAPHHTHHRAIPDDEERG